MTLLQIESDIHLEFGKKTLKHTGNHLALLGDIGKPFTLDYQDFIRKCSEQWEKVYLIPGNHEYWSSRHTMDDIALKMHDIADETGVNLLINDTTTIGHRTVFGGTFWADVPLNLAHSDFDKILTYKEREKKVKFKPMDMNELHVEAVCALMTYMKEDDIVVLTHHAPSTEVIGKKRTPHNYGYYANCGDMLKKMKGVWCHGHTHIACDIQYYGVRVVSNPMGYKSEDTGYEPGKCIEL